MQLGQGAPDLPVLARPARRLAGVAQTAERLHGKQEVASAILAAGSMFVSVVQRLGPRSFKALNESSNLSRHTSFGESSKRQDTRL